MLQLGHPANGVESPNCNKTLRESILASIGPPRERGGKSDCGPFCTSIEKGFNWATPRTGWKVAIDASEAVRVALASIGPPRERGGKVASCGTPTGGRGRFNWATPRTGWKATGKFSCRMPTSPASIGPPRERGGKHYSGGAARGET